MVPITVFTPTFNRAYTLINCYKSMRRQTNKNFQWLIIDDGSTDETRELVNKWKDENNEFRIIYIYKENGGMHTAHNVAYENINTELSICIDSDDYLTDNAIDIILKFWNKNGSNMYSGIIALDIYKNGRIIGNKLPNKRSICYNDFYEFGGKGDKKLIYRTQVMKKYPKYPIFEGEKFVSLGYKYLLADQEYELLILNEAICVVEYMSDGSTKNMLKQYMNNPNGFIFMRKLHLKYNKTFKRSFFDCIHYVSSSMIVKNRKFIKESPRKILTVLAMPFGVILYCIIKIVNGEKVKREQ